MLHKLAARLNSYDLADQSPQQALCKLRRGVFLRRHNASRRARSKMGVVSQFGRSEKKKKNKLCAARNHIEAQCEVSL